MKKILTLLVMFLATANILMAQTTAPTPTPKLTYQIVVRDANNNLVVNQDLIARVSILVPSGADYAESAYANKEISGKTNMNGMLTLTLEDAELANIDMSDAKVRIQINAYNITKEMPIYAVPYALLAANNDDALTTPAIVKYVKSVDTNAIEQIIQAFWDNHDDISTYLHDTVINYIKANKGAVRNLTLYFIEKTRAQDVEDAYNAISPEMKTTIANKAAEVAKNHKDAALEIALYYAQNFTTDDAQGIYNAVKENPAAKTIMKAAVDSVVEYIKNHQDLVIDLGKALVTSTTLTDAQMTNAWNTLKANQSTYDALKAILDENIKAHLDTSYIVSDSSCHPVDICTLNEQIAWMLQHGHTSCPEVSSVKISTSTSTNLDTHVYDGFDFTFSATFTNNNDNVDLTGADYMFVLNYPNTNYPKDTLHGTFDGNSTFSYAVNNPNDKLKFQGRYVEVTPLVKGLSCKALEVTNNTAAVVDDNNKECPQFAYFEYTNSNSSTALAENKGVKLTAKVTSNYGNIEDYGFVVVTANGNDTLRPGNTLTGLEFTDTLDMSYCGQTVTVYPFVKCGSYVDGISAQFTLRGLTLEITASRNTWATGDANEIVLTAVNAYPISDPTYTAALGNTPSVEAILAYAQQKGYNPSELGFGGYDYVWEFPSAGTHVQGATENIQNVNLETANSGSYTYKVTFNVELFGATCSVSAEKVITRQ